MQWLDTARFDDAVEWDRNNDLQTVSLSIRLDQAIALLCKCPYIQGHSCKFDGLAIEMIRKLRLTLGFHLRLHHWNEKLVKIFTGSVQNSSYSGGVPRRS